MDKFVSQAVHLQLCNILGFGPCLQHNSICAECWADFFYLACLAGRHFLKIECSRPHSSYQHKMDETVFMQCNAAAYAKGLKSFGFTRSGFWA